MNWCQVQGTQWASLGWLVHVQWTEGICGVWPMCPLQPPLDSGLLATSCSVLCVGIGVWDTWSWPCKRLCQAPSEGLG